MNYDFEGEHLKSNEMKVFHNGDAYYCIGIGSPELEKFAFQQNLNLYWTTNLTPNGMGCDTGSPYFITKDDYLKLKEKMNNTPTKEQILEAAETSSEAKAVLAKLFPDYFPKPVKRLSNEKISEYNQKHGNCAFALVNDMGGKSNTTSYDFLNVVNFGDYYGRGFLLSSDKNQQQFEIIKRGEYQILVPVIEE